MQNGIIKIGGKIVEWGGIDTRYSYIYIYIFLYMNEIIKISMGIDYQ